LERACAGWRPRDAGPADGELAPDADGHWPTARFEHRQACRGVGFAGKRGEADHLLLRILRADGVEVGGQPAAGVVGGLLNLLGVGPVCLRVVDAAEGVPRRGQGDAVPELQRFGERFAVLGSRERVAAAVRQLTHPDEDEQGPAARSARLVADWGDQLGQPGLEAGERLLELGDLQVHQRVLHHAPSGAAQFSPSPSATEPTYTPAPNSAASA